MDLTEPEIINYEEIPVPEETCEPGTSGGDTSSSSSEDENSSKKSRLDSPTEDRDRTDRIRSETIDMILDCIVAPRQIERRGKQYICRLSRQPSSRVDIVHISKRFEDYIRERQVRMQGFCPVRRELYDLLFDELIRQSTVFCPERGALLLKVRDEIQMTLAAYEKLFENGIEYGTRKAFEAEIETQSLHLQHSQLEAEVKRAEKRITELKGEIDAEETLSGQRLELKQLRHEEKMDFLKKANKQLKEQLSIISSN